MESAASTDIGSFEANQTVSRSGDCIIPLQMLMITATQWIDNLHVVDMLMEWMGIPARNGPFVHLIKLPDKLWRQWIPCLAIDPGCCHYNGSRIHDGVVNQIQEKDGAERVTTGWDSHH